MNPAHRQSCLTQQPRSYGLAELLVFVLALCTYSVSATETEQKRLKNNIETQVKIRFINRRIKMRHQQFDYFEVSIIRLLRSVLFLIFINMPTFVEAGGDISLYTNDKGASFSYADLSMTRSNNIDGTRKIMGVENMDVKDEDIQIFNNWPPNEEGSNDLTHYLYSPEDFNFSFDEKRQVPHVNENVPQPLGNRTPIILVHGWQGEKETASPVSQQKNELSAEKYWKSFIKFFTEYHSLKNFFKIYVYKYPSYKHVTFNARLLRNMLTDNNTIPELKEYFSTGKKAIFVAHSMGTIVVRSAFEEHNLPIDYAEKIILLDGVHHGSPAAIPFWVNGNTLPKDLYTLGANDIQWDNYDDIFGNIEDKNEKMDATRIFQDITMHPCLDPLCTTLAIMSLQEENLNAQIITDTNQLGGEIPHPPTNGAIMYAKKRGIFYGSENNSDGRTNDAGTIIRLNSTLLFDSYFRNKISEIKNDKITLPVLKKYSQAEHRYVVGTYNVTMKEINFLTGQTEDVEKNLETFVPTLPNPWLIYLNLKHQTMSDEYKKKIILYAGIHSNHGGKNDHIYNDWGFGFAEDGVQHLGELFDENPYLGGHYGYLNDGPVPINSQLMDMLFSFRELEKKHGSKQVTMYSNWVKSEGKHIYTPPIDRYEGDGKVKHILFMDYHHDRMLNGAYKNNSDDLFVSYETGFDSQDERKLYVSNALDDFWNPSEQDLSAKENALRLEPLFLSIAYQLVPKRILVSVDPCNFLDVELDVEKETYKSVHELCNLGILKGYPDGTFGVGKEINRAEFLTIMLKTRDHADPENELKCDPSNSGNTEKSFPDIVGKNWAWAVKYIESAKEKKCIGGYPDGTFGPDKTINRAEAAKIIANVFVPGEVARIFTDKKEVNKNSCLDDYNDTTTGEWYCEYLTALNGTGIMSGYSKKDKEGKVRFGVNDKMLREQAAIVACRAYAHKKRRNISEDFCGKK